MQRFGEIKHTVATGKTFILCPTACTQVECRTRRAEMIVAKPEFLLPPFLYIHVHH